MGVKANATDAAAAWASGMSAAGPKYTAGVQNVKTAPGVLAAASADTWANNVAMAKQKFAAKVGAVSLSAWQNAAVTKGAPRLASGAQAAQPKMQAFMTNFIPFLSNTVNSLPARGTFETNVNRLTTYINAVHAAKGTF
jgi:hypothetical protein